MDAQEEAGVSRREFNLNVLKQDIGAELARLVFYYPHLKQKAALCRQKLNAAADSMSEEDVAAFSESVRGMEKQIHQKAFYIPLHYLAIGFCLAAICAGLLLCTLATPAAFVFGVLIGAAGLAAGGYVAYRIPGSVEKYRKGFFEKCRNITDEMRAEGGPQPVDAASNDFH